MPAAKRLHLPAVEPLEARIAPALLVNGANLLGGDSPSSGETSVGDHSVTLVKVLSGRALVWFDGTNITSISAGPGLKIDITGDVGEFVKDAAGTGTVFVPGDIVANLTADGHLTDSDGIATNGDDGGVLLPNNILGITTHPLSDQKGSVGNIITGGTVSGVTIAGILNGIYAGDGAFRTGSSVLKAGAVASTVAIDTDLSKPGVQSTLDINPVAASQQVAFSFANTAAQLGQLKPGATISGVKISQGSELQIFAGDGSPSGSIASGNAVAGGGISNVQIDNASVPSGAPVGTPSYFLLAGDGGDGKRGGTGGSINFIIETTSSGPVKIKAGKGGIGSGAAGGGGGSVTNLDLQSASSQYNVTSGDGGDGTPAGAGGRMANNNFSNRTPIAGVLVSADFNNDGYGDVLVADSGTGQMVLSSGNSSGGFTQVVQHDATALIDPAGLNPVDALVTDVDGNGTRDVVVLYKDGTLAAFLNDGTGNFYDGTNSKFIVVSTSLGFTPAKFAQLDSGGFDYAIAENTEGKGTLHGITFGISAGTLVAQQFNGTLTYGLPIADVAGHFVGLNNGTIQQFQVVPTVNNSSALQAVQTLPLALTGGLSDLDVDSSAGRLLALSSGSRALAVYDVSGNTAVQLAVLPLTTVAGKPLQAKFMHDFNPTTPDDIVVLSNTVSSAQFTLVQGLVDNGTVTPFVPYALSTQFQSTSLLKNFVPVYDPVTPKASLAAVAGPLNDFTIVSGLSSEQTFPLPFASKQVTITSGNGGTGLDAGGKLGKGGAGGAIVNLNVDAQKITLTTGHGGDSSNGAAGAGGSLSNSIPPVTFLNPDGTTASILGTFKTAGGASVVPKLSAEASLDITVGDGGSATGTGGKSAAGGAGGGIASLDITLSAGDIALTAGKGGTGKGGNGGAGGSVSQVKTLAEGGSLTVTAGVGGAADGTTGNGGAGGSISGLTHTLSLDAEAEKSEKPYAVTLMAGAAGGAMSGIGGAGGNLLDIALQLDGADRTFDDTTVTPNLIDTHLNSTVSITAAAGRGGDGVTSGGLGGSVRGFKTSSVFDQKRNNSALLNYVVLSLTAGRGGDATGGNGGVGGSVTLTKPISGITYFDPDLGCYDPMSANFDPARTPLSVVAGNGGDGSAKGGAGGAVSGLTAQNSAFFDGRNIAVNQLFGASVRAGDGGKGGSGNGGEGGSVTNAQLGVLGSNPDAFNADHGVLAATNLKVIAGTGGASTTAKGGAGGMVSGSEFGLVGSFFSVGMDIQGGGGGAGKTFGGTGGTVSGLRINTPQSTVSLSALITAGAGGAADSSAGAGGKGGDINGVTQAKDFNSSINLIEAGNGGANTSGPGGVGGNVLKVHTVGFIGRPSDSTGTQLGVFDSYLFDDDNNPATAPISKTIAQGIFSGRGSGSGANGFITDVKARQIAAMAAAPDLATGLFAVASKIASVTADLIGFDKDGDKECDDAMNVPIVLPASPKTVKPADGFILADTIAMVTVGGQSIQTARPKFVFDV